MTSTVIFARNSSNNNNNIAEQKTSLLRTGSECSYGADDYDQDCYSDEDVFIDECNEDSASLWKPLMPARSKSRLRPCSRSKVTTRRPPCRCRYLIRPICCFLLLVSTLSTLMVFILYMVGSFSGHSHSKVKGQVSSQQSGGGRTGSGQWSSFSSDGSRLFDQNIVGCSNVEVEDVWVVGLPKLTTESAMRLVDVNSDGHLDIIFGFGTGVDGKNIPEVVCKIYFGNTFPCFGGVMAVEGLTGKELWRHYSKHEVYGLNCNSDLNGDTVPDCLAGGRAGVFQVISGRDGSLIWDFGEQKAKNSIMNLYTAQFIRDLNGDGVLDILAVHGGDPLQLPGSVHRLPGRLVIFSGKDGKVLRWVGVPDKRESYYSPQVYMLPGGTEMVIFGTGGETHPGSLWRISLSDLYAGKIERAEKIYGDGSKGVMTPPVLLDLTGDGIEDIVVPLFNSTVLAIDGLTMTILWNHSFPSSESYNTPAAGYYNNDDIPDFMVKYAHGPGFPVYYYSQTTILDGRTGSPLISPSIKDTVGAISSPLTISMEGFGNDLFLFWVADCLGHEGEGTEFAFVKGTDVHKKSRADFCRMRFKSKGYAKLYATSQHIKAPGKTLYYSEERHQDEHKAWVNTTEEVLKFISRSPEYLDDYLYYLSLTVPINLGENDQLNVAEKQRMIDEYGPLSKQSKSYYGRLESGSDRNQGIPMNERKLPLQTGSRYDRGYKGIEAARTLGVGRGNFLGRGIDNRVGGNSRLKNNNQRIINDVRIGNNRRMKTDSTRYGDFYDTAGVGAGGGVGVNGGIVGVGGSRGGGVPVSGGDRGGGGIGTGYRGMDSPRDYSSDSQDYSLYPYPQNGQNSQEETRIRPNTNGIRYRNYENKNQYSDTDQYNYGRMRQKRIERQPAKLNKAADIKQDGKWRRLHTDIRPENDSNNARGDTLQELSNMIMRRKRSINKLINSSKISIKNQHDSQHETELGEKERIYREIRSRSRKTKYSEKNILENLKKIFSLKRNRRHIGPHDTKGLMRLISTGSLVPSNLPPNHPDFNHSMDIVFATYWFYPAETRIILPKDKKCIQQRLDDQAIRFDQTSKYYGMDDDTYEHVVTEECLQVHGKKEHHHDNYNPYNIPMGQMTLYRLRITCTCKDNKEVKNGTKHCARMLPFTDQQWPAYMGSRADSHWLPRHRDRTHAQHH
ncbi:protein FAM234B-like [Argonauta hians]